jgi:hypothetical protein
VSSESEADSYWGVSESTELSALFVTVCES